MKKKFYHPGWSAPLLAKCYATDGPNQKSHKCLRECFKDYDWLHYDVEDDKENKYFISTFTIDIKLKKK